MAKREDGKETRRRLLSAACKIFAQKGYRHARVAEICQLAGANVASVNYHFGDKDSLYKEVWKHTLSNFDGSAFSGKSAGSPRELLNAYIHMLIQHFVSKDELGQFSRLYLMELVSPTGLIQDAWHEVIEPRRRILHDIIRKIVSPGADEQCILFCELSIVNQCRALVTIKDSDLEYLLREPLSKELIKRLAGHIADFSLAGIEAVGKNKAG